MHEESVNFFLLRSI